MRKYTEWICSVWRQRETTSAIFPRHDSHRWLLRRCLATVAAVLRHQLPPAKWWESLTCCEQQNTRRRRESVRALFHHVVPLKSHLPHFAPNCLTLNEYVAFSCGAQEFGSDTTPKCCLKIHYKCGHHKQHKYFNNFQYHNLQQPSKFVDHEFIAAHLYAYVSLHGSVNVSAIKLLNPLVGDLILFLELKVKVTFLTAKVSWHFHSREWKTRDIFASGSVFQVTFAPGSESLVHGLNSYHSYHGRFVSSLDDSYHSYSGMLVMCYLCLKWPARA